MRLCGSFPVFDACCVVVGAVSESGLSAEELLSCFAVDAALEGGEDGFAVFGEDEGSAGFEFADLFWADDGGESPRCVRRL